MHRLLRKLGKGITRDSREINPEDIFLDSANLPGLNRDRLEGRIERPIGEKTFLLFKLGLAVLLIFLGGKLWGLQVIDGNVYAEVSEENRLSRIIIFADRGVIFDRNGLPLAENSIKPGEDDYAARNYADLDGLSAIVGYIKYPSKDSSGNYYDESYRGQSGVEKMYDEHLSGENGSKLIETDALGNITSESVIDFPEKGNDLHLSIDAKLTSKLYETISATSEERGFTGGAAVIMDVNNGEVLALTSYPEVNLDVVTDGTDIDKINSALIDESTPFLNRAVSGLYTPGSIVKPIVAIGALTEDVIDPETQILSTGALTIPNPYYPDNPTIFKDWKAHGWVNMWDALAVSSDVYFYEIGGGFEAQEGLGIAKLDQYFSMFGLSDPTGIDLPSEVVGYIATPDWKALNFPKDPDWRIGNTYHTAIGQYGTQITPISAARFTSAIANSGTLLRPTVVKKDRDENDIVYRKINLDEKDFEIAREGMRESVKRGTASGLSNPNVTVAGKTGTAEIGLKKEYVNSWVIGFFPYENPRYAFVVIM
ncbi:MAG: peptidoglycan D,D-transpeptidase FtsI family protein, partial [Minisyncoccota bacterium]